MAAGSKLSLPATNPAGMPMRPASRPRCNNGVGNGPEGCTPGNAPPNDEHPGAGPGNPGRGGN
jgi:hypothetical protein